MESDAKYLQDQEDRYRFLKAKIAETYKEFSDIGEEFQKAIENFPNVDINEIDDIVKRSFVKSSIISYLQTAMLDSLKYIENSKTKEED